jgi:aspartate/glutamate racemase
VSALIAELEQAGATTIIAGCTEISTMLQLLETATPLVDPSEALARVTVHRATRASA